MRRPLVIAALLAAIGACGAPETSRCEQLCARHASCEAQITGGERDAAGEAQCVLACSIFERDDEARAQVDARAACLEAAGDCEAVRACARAP
jgi:hypothetical protein